jgi:hypothetical protein
MHLLLLLQLDVPLLCLLLQAAPACHAALLHHPSPAAANRHCCLQQRRQPDAHHCTCPAEQLQQHAYLLSLPLPLPQVHPQLLLCLLLLQALRPGRCQPAPARTWPLLGWLGLIWLPAG